jgi:hypothetical protein
MRNILTSAVAKQLYERVFGIFGVASAITSDRGPQFTSALWDELCKLMNIRKCLKSPYNAKCNGSVESRNRSIVEMLRCMCNDKPKHWCEYLSSVIFALNSSCHTMSNLTPNVITFGRDLPNIFDTGTIQNEELKPMHEFLHSMLEKQRFAYAQVTKLHAKRDVSLKKAYDKDRRPVSAREGDVVFYYRPILPDPKSNKKMQRRYIGPLMITQLHENGTALLKCLSSGKFLKSRVNLNSLKRPSYYRLMPGTIQYENATEIIEELEANLQADNNMPPCRNVDMRPLTIDTVPPPNDNKAVGPMYAPKLPYSAVKIKVD